MTAYPLRWAPLFVVGLVSGLAQVIAGVIMYLSGVYFEPWSLWVIIAELAAGIAVGNWWYGRHVLGGRTTYWKALLIGVVISVSTGLVYITYNIVSISFVYPHFLEDMVQAQFARASVGMDAARAAQLLDSLRAEITLRTLVTGNLRGASTVGTLLSILISVAFRKGWRRAPRVVAQSA